MAGVEGGFGGTGYGSVDPDGYSPEPAGTAGWMEAGEEVKDEATDWEW